MEMGSNALKEWLVRTKERVESRLVEGKINVERLQGTTLKLMEALALAEQREREYTLALQLKATQEEALTLMSAKGKTRYGCYMSHSLKVLK